VKRVFFGLAPEATTALAIADWRDRQLRCAGRPVSLANFHLTLAFVGELPEPALERLCNDVEDWLPGAAIPADTLTLDCAGYWHRPGIYWLGATHWPPPLTRLADKLGTLSGAVGGKRDRRNFQPHVTLYRRCTEPPPGPALPPSIPMPYRRCTLFESRQGRQGVSYHCLVDWPLALTG